MTIMNLTHFQMKYLCETDNIFYIPAFQREKVWGIPNKSGVIDTLLRGLPISPLIIVKVTTILGNQFGVLDGQQRLVAFREFRQGGFPLAKRPRPGDPIPICAGTYYHDLPFDVKSNFDDYQVPVLILEGLNEEMQGLLFRRMQIHVPLTQGEILYSRNVKAAEYISQLLKHDFFNKIYVKKSNRKESYQCCLIMFMLERAYTRNGECWANVTTPRRADTVNSIEIDNGDLLKKINKRLDWAIRLYDGATYTSISETIVIYQSIILLEMANANFAQCKVGALSVWFTDAHNKSYAGRRKVKIEEESLSVYQTETGNMQKEFWKFHLDKILSLPGIILLDEKRQFSPEDISFAYKAQDGRCPRCGNLLVIEKAAPHHKIPHAYGGKTNSGNCILLHQECHMEIHTQGAELFLM